jgi:hypothetical protein
MDYFIIKKIKKKIISFLFDLINLSLEEKNIEIINTEELMKQIDDYVIELEQSLLLNSPIIKKNSLKNKFNTNEVSIEYFLMDVNLEKINQK